MLPIILVALAATVLRIFLINRDSVIFAYDMGRDLLWAKDIVFYQTPTLIGPAASIWGVYFGPLWYYFLSVPLFLTGGNPLAAVYITAATIVATGILAFLLFKKIIGSNFALILAILILFNSTLINISTFAFHANVLPLLTLLMVYFCFMAVVKNPIFLSVALLSISLMFHADPAPAVANTFIPITIAIIFKLYKSKNFRKTLLYSIVAYLAPFAPQILFEARNNFIQTKSLIAYFQGENPSLSGQLPPLERITNRADIFFDFFKESFTPQSNLLASLILFLATIGIYYFFKKIKNKNLGILAQINLYAIIITFLVFTMIITVEVKNWYLYGTIVIFANLAMFAISAFKKFRLILMVFLIVFTALNVYPFLKKERAVQSSLDPAQLANQLTAIDIIYQDAQGQPFSVYTFTPSIYDHNYQYLFWWQGQRLDRGLPQDFAYLPNQPDYVRNKDFYSQKSSAYAASAEKSDVVYLIIETAQENEFYTSQAWLKNFDDYKIIWEKDINGVVALQKRVNEN